MDLLKSPLKKTDVGLKSKDGLLLRDNLLLLGDDCFLKSQKSSSMHLVRLEFYGSLQFAVLDNLKRRRVIRTDP